MSVRVDKEERQTDSERIASCLELAATLVWLRTGISELKEVENSRYSNKTQSDIFDFLCNKEKSHTEY